MGRLENLDRPAYHLHKQCFLKRTCTRLPSQCVSSQRGSESCLLAAQIIEMIELFRGQAFVPRLVLIVGAKICRKECLRGLLFDDDAYIVTGKRFSQPSSKVRVYLYGAPSLVKIVCRGPEIINAPCGDWYTRMTPVARIIIYSSVQFR
jgi:hypothetical protein